MTRREFDGAHSALQCLRLKRIDDHEYGHPAISMACFFRFGLAKYRAP
jgi:hypothetical protein